MTSNCLTPPSGQLALLYTEARGAHSHYEELWPLFRVTTHQLRSWNCEFWAGLWQLLKCFDLRKI